jgi:hypothetical protein
VVHGDPGEQGVQVSLGELPLEGGGHLFVVLLEGQQPRLHLGEAGEVAGGELGEGNHNVIFNNCEHFARWCATGGHESEQVRSVAVTTGTVITPILATALTGTVISPAGPVAGLSGPGIMSGLATYGAIVGGGTVAGRTRRRAGHDNLDRLAGVGRADGVAPPLPAALRLLRRRRRPLTCCFLVRLNDRAALPRRHAGQDRISGNDEECTHRSREVQDPVVLPAWAVPDRLLSEYERAAQKPRSRPVTDFRTPQGYEPR